MAVLAAEPQLYVSDLGAALAWYEARLGFEIAFSYGEPAFYGQVTRGGARINLRHADGPVFDPDFRSAEPDAVSATLTVTDVDELAREFAAAGVVFHQEPRTEPWGARTFMVRDPAGNLLLFAG